MNLELLLKQCTVQLTIVGPSKGTGFFVAPGLILTCNHVIQKHQGKPVLVRWQDQSMFTQATVKDEFPDLDLALLHFTPTPNLEPHPCVYLDVALHQGDVFSLFGYPDRDYPNGCPVTGECEGHTGDNPPFIKFKHAEIRPGISGAPLLNLRTGKVCGMVKFTRNRDSDLGGGAIPTSTILQALPELENLQAQFHQSNYRWTHLLPVSFDPPQFSKSIQQTSQGNNTQIIAHMSDSMAIKNVEGSIYINPIVYQTDSEVFQKSVQEKYIDPAKEGLDALATLTSILEVQQAVTTFQVTFEAACQQIDTIANYKTLHDLLHTLELHCYQYILKESKHLLNSSTSLSNLISRNPTLQNLFGSFLKIDDREILGSLMNHNRTLQNLLRSIEKNPAIKARSPHEARWLSQLQEAQVELYAAIEKQEFHRLPQGLNLLKRVLATAPSHVNTRLVAAAQSLRLTSLISSMQIISEKLVGVSLNHNKLQQFQQGIESLRALNSQLDILVTTHDNWQMFDLDLRRIEDNLEQDITELEVSWPSLLEQTKVLIDSTKNPWIIAFQQDIQDLDEALTSQNSLRVKQCFHVCYRQAKESFYHIDKTLNHFCGELREVGGALALVLRMIG